MLVWVYLVVSWVCLILSYLALPCLGHALACLVMSWTRSFLGLRLGLGLEFGLGFGPCLGHVAVGLEFGLEFGIEFRIECGLEYGFEFGFGFSLLLARCERKEQGLQVRGLSRRRGGREEGSGEVASTTMMSRPRRRSCASPCWRPSRRCGSGSSASRCYRRRRSGITSL